MKLIDKLFSFFIPKLKEPMSPKDPMDWKLTENSKKWETDTYCPQCKKYTEHREIMSHICNGCGFLGDMRNYRSYREIWNGEKWVRQFKYGNGPKDYEIHNI
jgi:hypothetical protein